jgi:hypothetical protein
MSIWRLFCCLKKLLLSLISGLFSKCLLTHFHLLVAMVTKTTPPIQLNSWIDAENSKVPSRLHGMRFASSGSPDYLYINDAVQFAAQNGGVLQSLEDAAAIRVDNDGSIADANEYQITRTVPLYFMADGAWHVAVGDSPSADENLVLARPAVAQEAFSSRSVWTLPQSDNLVKRMMKLAEKEGRVFALPSERQPYRVALDEFGSDAVAQAFFNDVASAYAAFLKDNNLLKGRFYLLNNGLSNIGGNEVGVRPVGLGNYYLYDVNAGDNIDNDGRSRPVALAKNFVGVL